MELDHDSGALRGRVLAGWHQGAALDDLIVLIDGMFFNGVCVQPVSATPLVVYRLAFGSPRSFADVD
jgi:hypothetical protein